MKVGIICASEEELEPFLSILSTYYVKDKAKLQFYCGKISDVEVIALFSGVGKVNAAISAQILIDDFGIDGIINSGTAGAIDENLDIFDTVISVESAYHDCEDDIFSDMPPYLSASFFEADKKLLQSANRVVHSDQAHKVLFGRMVTGDKFITDNGRDEIIFKFSPLTVDMETAAIAHVCYANSVPFIAVRTVTDTPKNNGIEVFEINCKQASAIAANIAVGIIKNI